VCYTGATHLANADDRRPQAAALEEVLMAAPAYLLVAAS
jgi:hypothetical protein